MDIIIIIFVWIPPREIIARVYSTACWYSHQNKTVIDDLVLHFRLRAQLRGGHGVEVVLLLVGIGKQASQQSQSVSPKTRWSRSEFSSKISQSSEFGRARRVSQ